MVLRHFLNKGFYYVLLLNVREMLNRSLFYGEGLFETIRWKGITKRLKLHYDRLRSSAEFFSIECPTWEEFVKEILKRVGDDKDVYVKVCLFALGDDLFFKDPERSFIQVVKKPLPNIPDKVSLGVSSHKKHSGNPLVYHKTTSYLFNILVKREALKRGFYDALVLNEKGEVTECSSSNIIVLRGSRLYTPAYECGLLWGTTLSILYEKMDIKQERLRLPDIMKADAVFITNAIVDVLPVVEIEGKQFIYEKELHNEMKHILSLEDSVLG